MVLLQCRQHNLLVPHQAVFAIHARILYVEEMPRIACLLYDIASLEIDDRRGCKSLIAAEY